MDEIFKVCSVCGESKPLDAYNRQKAGRNGRRANCRACQSEAHRAYKDTDEGRRKAKAWKKTPTGRAAAKRYRESEACKASTRKRAATVEYKRRKRKVTDEIRFGGNREKALDRDGGKCVICGGDSHIQVHHKDELGRNKPGNIQNHDLDNLITLCGACHLKQHNPVLIRWARAKGGGR